ncbi:MAG TPA: hypothetical protein PLV52_07900, partial [Candidatus Omnitrophota bacterium]|nr:hypothetical protein [Candidatus Omnitrophota bacterium]
MKDGLPILVSLVSRALKSVSDRPVVLLLDGDSCVGKTRFLNRRVIGKNDGSIRLISRDDYISDSTTSSGVVSDVDWALLSTVIKGYQEDKGVRLIIVEGSELWRLHEIRSDVRVWITADNSTRRANMDRRVEKRGVFADGTIEPSNIMDTGFYHLILDNSSQYMVGDDVKIDFFAGDGIRGEDVAGILAGAMEDEAHTLAVKTVADDDEKRSAGSWIARLAARYDALMVEAHKVMDMLDSEKRHSRIRGHARKEEALARRLHNLENEMGRLRGQLVNAGVSLETVTEDVWEGSAPSG